MRIKDAQNELRYNYWIFLKAEVNLLILPQITVQVADTQTQGEKEKGNLSETKEILPARAA